MCYNTFVNSARFFRTQRTMRSRHALLLTPLESALASRSQLTENTATLSLSESALTKNAGVGGCTSDSGTRHSPPIARHHTQVLSFHTLPHSFEFTKNATLLFSTYSALFVQHTGCWGSVFVQ